MNTSPATKIRIRVKEGFSDVPKVPKQRQTKQHTSHVPVKIRHTDEHPVASLKPSRKRSYTEEGYVRIWHGPDRGMYEHRVVMRDILQNQRICADYVFPVQSIDPKSGLPYGMVVHHDNGKRDDNHGPNLVLMDVAIHDAISPCKTQKDRLSSRLRIQPPAKDEDNERQAIQGEASIPEIDIAQFWEDAAPISRPMARAPSISRAKKAVA